MAKQPGHRPRGRGVPPAQSVAQGGGEGAGAHGHRRDSREPLGEEAEHRPRLGGAVIPVLDMFPGEQEQVTADPEGLLLSLEPAGLAQEPQDVPARLPAGPARRLARVKPRPVRMPLREPARQRVGEPAPGDEVQQRPEALGLRQLGGLRRLDEPTRGAGLGQLVEHGREVGELPGGGHVAQQIQAVASGVKTRRPPVTVLTGMMGARARVRFLTAMYHEAGGAPARRYSAGTIARMGAHTPSCLSMPAS